jgi:hypothetical protein
MTCASSLNPAATHHPQGPLNANRSQAARPPSPAPAAVSSAPAARLACSVALLAVVVAAAL